MSGRPKQGRQSEAEALEALLAEARGTIKDLRAAIREARELAACVAGDTAQAARTAGGEELTRYARHLQQEMNRASADLNAGIERAQRHIIKCLSLARLEIEPDGKSYKFFFEGQRFDEDYPLPGQPAEGGGDD